MSSILFKTITFFLLGLVPNVLSHNYVDCINSKPNLTDLLTEKKGPYSAVGDYCDGFPRGMPSSNTAQASAVGNQGFPWQFIWPMQDSVALNTHRACNWLQENPTYDPEKNITSVKPGATILIRVSTNAHSHEYAKRASGHYKIYIAGDAGTHITTTSQLTDDRVVFFAPENKYAHIIGNPSVDNGQGDPGYAWLPFKLVDPAGNPLPAGTFNFVWTWWWPTAVGDQFEDFMIPSYTTCFDVTIDEGAEDAGYLTEVVKNDPNAHIGLIGNTTSPGAKDQTSPWPPYPDGYLTQNFDGLDPADPSAKRTFQPYFDQHVDALKMPAPIRQKIPPIGSWSAAQLAQQINSPPGSGVFPPNLTAAGSILSKGQDQMPVTEKLAPLKVGPGSGFGDTDFYPNSSVTDPMISPNSSNFTDVMPTPANLDFLSSAAASTVSLMATPTAALPSASALASSSSTPSVPSPPPSSPLPKPAAVYGRRQKEKREGYTHGYNPSEERNHARAWDTFGA